MQESRKRFQRKFNNIYSVNSIRVCVDSVNNGNLSGRFYSKMSSDPISFSSIAKLLLGADKLFDLRGYPQNFEEKRSFTKQKVWSGKYSVPSALLDDETVLAQRGLLFTFDILVQSRHRAGWQGIIVNLEGEAVEFQSELELLESIEMEMKKW